jgi:hypothetical protein
MNYAMASFFSIEDAAAMYASVMGLWERYVAVLPLRYHTVRYENLVEDPAVTTRALFDYLALEWTEDVLRHPERARLRRIDTPSYHQVSRPIYVEARYRWRRYASQLKPVAPVLAPFVERFGYER